MQPNQQAFQQEVQAEVTAHLQEHLYPAHFIPASFHDQVVAALRFESPKSLDMDVPRFTSILTNPEHKYTLLDMYHLLNSIEVRTMDQLKMEPVHYCEMQETMVVLAKAWNNMVEPVQKAIQRRIATKLRITNGGKAIPIGKFS